MNLGGLIESSLEVENPSIQGIEVERLIVLQENHFCKCGGVVLYSWDTFAAIIHLTAELFLPPPCLHHCHWFYPPNDSFWNWLETAPKYTNHS